MADPSELTYLSSKLGFTLAELELNRVGQLSSQQSWTALRAAMLSLGITFVIVGMALAILAGKPSALVRWIVVIPVVGLTLAWSGVSFVGSIQRTVVSADGPLALRTFRGSRQLIVGNASVEAPAEAGALVVGRRYRIHYLGRTDTFLSIEPL
jgi:hypothetical protein